MMTILDQLASALNRRDEVPNQELAKRIADSNNKAGVAELVEHLADKKLQSDCIKTLDEVAKLKPELVAPYTPQLLELLTHKNNRLQWGAMAVLHAITHLKQAEMYKALPQIIASADKGSVITNDHCVGILIALYAVPKYANDVFALLNERLLKSPTNQLPMYAEQVLPVVKPEHIKLFEQTLTARLPEIEKDSKRLRVEKVLKKIRK